MKGINFRLILTVISRRIKITAGFYEAVKCVLIMRANCACAPQRIFIPV